MERLQVILMLVADQYKREAREAATATTGISTSAQAAGKQTNTMSGALRNAGTAAKVGLGIGAAAALISFGKASVTAASNLQESMNAVQVTFGDAAEGINAIGERSVESFGLSQRAFNEFAVRFSAFAQQIAQREGKDVVDVVDEMTTRVADFASVMNLDMEEAARVIQSALAGETEAFRRFGGDVSAAAVQLKAAELGLGDTSAELTEQEKILARYHLIMEQTEKTAGDFANTSDSLANQQRQLKGAWEDLQATLGAHLLPVVEDVVGGLGDLLTIGNAIADLFGQGDGETSLFGGFLSGVKTTLGQLSPLNNLLRIGGDWLKVLAEWTGGADEAVARFNVRIGAGEEALDKYNEAARANTVAIDEQTIAAGIGEGVLDKYNDMAREGGAAWDTNTGSIQANIDALTAQQDAIRAQTDPLFALYQATQDQAEAQQALNDLVAKGVTDGPEYEQALIDVGIAALDVKDAQAQARVATDLTKQAFIDQQVAAGTARDKAQELADVLYGLSGLRLDPIQLAVEIRELRRAAGSQAGGYQEYHAGGIVTGGSPGDEVLARLQVGELVIPRSRVPMLGISPQTAAGGGGVVIESVYAMGTPAQIAHDVGQQVALELRMA